MSHSFCAPSPSPAPYSEAPYLGNEYLVNIISGVVAVVLVSSVLVVITYMVTKWFTKKKLLKSSTKSSDFSPDSCEVHWYNHLWLLFSARCMCTVNKIWLCPCLIASPDPWWGAFKRHQYQGCPPMSCKWIWAAVPSAWLCPFGNQEWVHSILHIVQQMLLTNGPVRFWLKHTEKYFTNSYLFSSTLLSSLLSPWPDLHGAGSSTCAADEAAGAFSWCEGYRDRTSRAGLPIQPRGSLPDAEGMGRERVTSRWNAALALVAGVAGRTEKDAPGTGCWRTGDKLWLSVIVQSGQVGQKAFETKYCSL